jgi:hypothetical protein
MITKIAMNRKRERDPLKPPGATRLRPDHQRRAWKGQSLVETAMLGIVLLMLLAAAIDFGRAFYTAVVVSNMAAEGAAYAALYPDLEFQTNNCSYRTVTNNISIQERARMVARERGLVIDRQDQLATTISVTPSDCRRRCAGTAIRVQVTYPLNDLFLPGILGVREIPITRSASQTIMRNPDRGHSCDGG